MSEESTSKKEVKGFIFYPRSYHIVDGNIHESYAIGVSEGGRECQVYILPEEHHVEAAKNQADKRIPSFEDFNDSEPPCQAHPDNGPDNPISMILMEQAEQRVIEGKNGNQPVMVAKWASVLKLNERAIAPPVGYGYLEINVGLRSEESQHLVSQLNDLQAQIDSKQGDVLTLESQRDQLVTRLYSSAGCFFSAIMMDYKHIHQIDSREMLEGFLARVYDRYTRDGRFAGAMVRVRDDSNVYLDDCSIYEVRYNSQAGAIEPFSESFDRFMKFGGHKSLQAAQRRQCVCDVIPVQRINLGPMGVGRYQKDLAMAGASKMMKTYVESQFYCKPQVNLKREKAFLYSRVALRMAKVKKGAGKGNQIVSSIHAYMKPRGNAFQVNHEAKPVYKVVRNG